MIVLDNGDAIRGIAEVASKLSFTVSGYVGTTATSLAQGQIASTEGDLYASSADATVVTSITVVNTDSAARTFTLYFLESGGGTSWAITPVSLDLGIGHSFYTDGQRITVLDASGNITYSITQNLGNLTNVTLTGEADHDMLYYDNATSLWKNATPATILAQLSGQAGAAFDFNSQNVTGIGGLNIGTDLAGFLSNATDTLNRVGVFTDGVYIQTNNGAAGAATRVIVGEGAEAAIAWALCNHTGIKLGGAFDADGQDITNLGNIQGRATDHLYLINMGAAKRLFLDSRLTAANTGRALELRTYNNLDAITSRFHITGGVAEAVGTFAAINLVGVKFGGIVNLNGQNLDAGSSYAKIITTGADSGLRITSTQDGTLGARLALYQVSANSANSDSIGRFIGLGKDDGATERSYGYWDVQIEDVQAGSYAGKMQWVNRLATAWNTGMKLSGAGELFVDVDSAGGEHVGSVDHLDDAKMLYAFSQGQINTLIKEGIVEVTEQDGRIDRMISLNRMDVVLAGGIYQTRALIEAMAGRLGISMESLIEEVKQIPESGWTRQPLALPKGG